MGQKQAISFEPIIHLLGDNHFSASLRSLLQPAYRLTLADNGSVPGHSELGKRLNGTIMPLGGQWCFPGGRKKNNPSGLAKALHEICIDSSVAESLMPAFSAAQSHVRPRLVLSVEFENTSVVARLSTHLLPLGLLYITGATICKPHSS